MLAKISHLQLSSKLKRLTKKRRLEKENDDDEVEAAEEINIRAGKSVWLLLICFLELNIYIKYVITFFPLDLVTENNKK